MINSSINMPSVAFLASRRLARYEPIAKYRASGRVSDDEKRLYEQSLSKESVK